MIEFWGRPYTHCDRIRRRDVLRLGALAMGGVTLADVLRTKACAAPSERPSPDTAVIQIFCGGGPSQLDTFDMKPDAPAEVRGEFKEIATAVPGIRICEHLPQLAGVMDKLAIVRSVTHTNSSHLPSSHLMQTGYEVASVTAGSNVHPSTGSVTARMRDAAAHGLPVYVAVPRGQAFSFPAYLGSAYGPFTTDIEPNRDDYHVPTIRLPASISRERVRHRRALLNTLDHLRRRADAERLLPGMDSYYRQAFEMVTDPRVAEAFDIHREPDALRARYGRSSMGQNCLLARRLVEAGVGYVSCLSGGGWDTHEDNFNRQKKVLLPRLDQAISALVTDLWERGLEKRVLVNVMGEFGRTPRINKDAGRDHWPGAFCALFSGGGLAMGQMVGTTDALGAWPTSRPYSPGDVLSTIYHVLGIDWRHVFHDGTGRPFPILPEGEPIPELVAAQIS